MHVVDAFTLTLDMSRGPFVLQLLVEQAPLVPRPTPTAHQRRESSSYVHGPPPVRPLSHRRHRLSPDERLPTGYLTVFRTCISPYTGLANTASRTDTPTTL